MDLASKAAAIRRQVTPSAEQRRYPAEPPAAPERVSWPSGGRATARGFNIIEVRGIRLTQVDPTGCGPHPAMTAYGLGPVTTSCCARR